MNNIITPSSLYDIILESIRPFEGVVFNNVVRGKTIRMQRDRIKCCTFWYRYPVRSSVAGECQYVATHVRITKQDDEYVVIASDTRLWRYNDSSQYLKRGQIHGYNSSNKSASFNRGNCASSSSRHQAGLANETCRIVSLP